MFTVSGFIYGRNPNAFTEELYHYEGRDLWVFENWLSTALRLDYKGRKCTTSVLFRILLIAAGRVVSVFAACQDLADAPCSHTVYDVLLATFPEIQELGQRLNRSLCHELPKALLRKSRILAIDLTLIPYHGQPALDIKKIFRSKPNSGTSHFPSQWVQGRTS